MTCKECITRDQLLAKAQADLAERTKLLNYQGYGGLARLRLTQDQRHAVEAARELVRHHAAEHAAEVPF